MTKDNNLEELITKSEFNDNYEELLETTENQLHNLHIKYLSLLGFRQDYRKAYKTHRIKHYIQNGILKFRLLTKRNIGYKSK